MAKRQVKSINKREYDALLELLRRTREEAGLTLYALSVAMNEDPAFAYKVEQKERRLDVVEFVEVCRALQQDPVELFKKWLGSIPSSG